MSTDHPDTKQPSTKQLCGSAHQDTIPTGGIARSTIPTGVKLARTAAIVVLLGIVGFEVARLLPENAPDRGSVSSFAAGGNGEAFSNWLVQPVEAQGVKGDYVFLPSRREMWVINRVNGKLVHYQLFDTESSTVTRSRIAVIDQKIFPPTDTEFLLSDRNLTGLLWVANRATGDFQLWRANRDETLSTDPFPVAAGDHLRLEASTPVRGRPERTNAGSSPRGQRPAAPVQGAKAAAPAPNVEGGE